MRLQTARDRVLGFVDENIIQWAEDEILGPTQSIAWGEGLSEHVISTIQIERIGFLKINLVWNLFGPNDEPLGVWLEEGTMPHLIEAKGEENGGANSLMWRDKGGRPIFRKKVKHPGTTGKHIMKRGWEAGRKAFENRIVRETTAYLKKDKIGGF